MAVKNFFKSAIFGRKYLKCKNEPKKPYVHIKNIFLFGLSGNIY